MEGVGRVLCAFLSLSNPFSHIQHPIRTLKVRQGFSPHFSDEQTEAKSGCDPLENPQQGRGQEEWYRSVRVHLGPWLPCPHDDSLGNSLLSALLRASLTLL